MFYNRHELPTPVVAHRIEVASGTVVESSKTNIPAVKQIEAGNGHTLMLLETGEIFAWGNNYHGQLGLGYASRVNEPYAFYTTRNDEEPEMIDEPTRIKKFDYVVTTGSGSSAVQTTMTGCVFIESFAVSLNEYFINNIDIVLRRKIKVENGTDTTFVEVRLFNSVAIN